jgi:hypothetical protein
MSSTYVVCSPTNAAASDSLSSFEGWLMRAFPGAREVKRHASETRALSWELSFARPDQWLEGWCSQDRTAICLKGDLDLVCQTAIALAELFPAQADAILVNDSQGILFDLRRMADAAQLAEAIVHDDDELSWQSPGDIGGH